MTASTAQQPDLFETLDAVATDWRPSRVEARREIRKAIAACAAKHGGRVHISWFRRDLPAWIDPHQIGSMIARLSSTGHLASAGEYLPNGGPSGNASKPALVRVLTKPIAIED